MTALRVLVCGGRDLRDEELIENTLDRLRAARGPFDCLILGGARGVDRIAGKWARKNGVLEWDFLPEWHRAGTHDGAVRNQRMIAEALPELVIAFPGGNGTADMVERARPPGSRSSRPTGTSFWVGSLTEPAHPARRGAACRWASTTTSTDGGA